MARSRNIKPSLFKNELLGEADPLMSLTFISLWCLADRQGRLEDRPLRIKAETFPYREGVDVNGYLTDLERLGFIHRYKIENIPYIQILNFKKHQSPHHTEKVSVIPEPRNIPINSDGCDLTVKTPLTNQTNTVDIPLIPDSLKPDCLIPEKNTNKKEENLIEKFFKAFWKLYPIKVNEDGTKLAFYGLMMNDVDPEEIMAGLEHYIKFRPAGREWLNPTTFLAKKAYLDRFEEPKPVEEKKPEPISEEKQKANDVIEALGEKTEIDNPGLVQYIAEMFKSKHGPVQFKNWLEGCAFVLNGNNLQLVTPSKFIKDWISASWHMDILMIAQRFKPNIQLLTFIIATEIKE